MTQELNDKLAFFREVLNEREPEPGDPEDRYEPSPLSDWGKQAIRESVLNDPRGIELVVEQIRKEPVKERIEHFVHITMMGVHNTESGERRSVVELRRLVLQRICEEAERQTLPPHFLAAFKLAWQEYAVFYDH